MLLSITRVHGGVLNALADHNGAGKATYRDLMYL